MKCHKEFTKNYLKGPVCTTFDDQKCVKRVYETIDPKLCMVECDGLMVTSYTKENTETQIG